MLEQSDICHIFTVHYDGTGAGSFVRVDGAITVPDDSPMSNDAGTDPFSTALWLLSANDASGPKAGSVAEARLYQPLTIAQMQAVEAELRAAYPYTPPT